MKKVAINGVGRIGKLVLKSLIEHGFDGEIALLNDPAGTPEQHAMWLEFDTIHGRWPGTFSYDADGVVINGRHMRLTHSSKHSGLPLKDMKIDVVIDCSGVFNTPPKVQPFFDAGVTKVIASTPIRQAPALNLVYGVNHDLYDADANDLVTATSSTANSLGPVIKIIHEELEIVHGSFTAIHNASNTQSITNRPGKDARRSRSALTSLVPSGSSAARSIQQIFPELSERLDGHTVRVPVLNTSLLDCVFEVTHHTTTDELNALFREYAEGPLRGVLGYEERPLVSADYLNDPRSCIIDGLCTKDINETQVKVLAWFDNEWGYACRLADITRMVVKAL